MRPAGAATGAALVAAVLLGSAAWGGATGDTGRVAFAAAAAVLLAAVALLAGEPRRCARRTGLEGAALSLAAWAGLAAFAWPDAFARSLAPFAWASAEGALGTAGGVAPSLDRGATARAALALAGVVFVAAAARAVVERGGRRALLRALSLVVLVGAGAALARGRYGEDEPLLLGLVTTNPLNAYGTFANRGHFAAWALALSAGPVGLLATSRGRGDRGLAAAALAVAAAAVVASGSRAGALGLGVGALVALSGAGRGGRRAALAVAGFAALAAAAAGLGLAPVTGLLPVRSDEASRLEIWAGSLRLWAEQPVVGVGLDAFRYAYPGDGRGPAGDWVAIAENDLLQALAETGAVGAALLVLGAVAAVLAWRRDRAAADARGPASLALAPLAAVVPLAMTGTPLHAPAVAAAAAVAWACARGLLRGEGPPAVRG